MKLFRTTVLFASISVLLTACNDNKDSPTPPNTQASSPQATTSLSGTVIVAGALQGAIVCLDKNNNAMCDNSEPQSTSNAQGQYTLNKITMTDSVRYGVIAIVPIGAIDHSSPTTTIDKPFVLTTPIKKHSVISPITTFIAEKMRANGNMDSQTAHQIVAYLLKLPDSNLFKNYSQDTTPTGKYLRDRAIVARHVFANSKQVIADNTQDSTYSNITKHTTAVLSHLSSMFIEITTTANYPVFFETNIKNKIEVSAVANNLIFNSLKFLPVSANELLNEPTLFSLNSLTHATYPSEGENAFEYSQLHFDNILNQIYVTDNIQKYNIQSHNTSPIATNANYVLSETGWTANNKLSIFDNSQEKTLIYKIDISNLPIKALTEQLGYLTNHYSFTFAISPDKIFPANTYAYKIIRIRLTDDYYHTGSSAEIMADNQEITTINALKNYTFNSDGAFLNQQHGLTILISQSQPEVIRLDYDFEVKLRPNHTVALVTTSRNNSIEITNIETTENSGFWAENTVKNTNLLAIKVDSFRPSNSSKKHSFYSEFNNKLVRGILEETGYIRENVLLTNTALEAIKAAIVPKAIP